MKAIARWILRKEKGVLVFSVFANQQNLLGARDSIMDVLFRIEINEHYRIDITIHEEAEG